jgi:hypothetical protein
MAVERWQPRRCSGSSHDAGQHAAAGLRRRIAMKTLVFILYAVISAKTVEAKLQVCHIVGSVAYPLPRS